MVFLLFPFRCLLVATRIIVLTCISTNGIFKKVELLSAHFIKDLIWIDNLAYTKKRHIWKAFFIKKDIQEASFIKIIFENLFPHFLESLKMNFKNKLQDAHTLAYKIMLNMLSSRIICRILWSWTFTYNFEHSPNVSQCAFVSNH